MSSAPSPSPSSPSSPYSITEEILQKRLKKPVRGHICRQIFAGCLACLSSLSFGTTLGWSHSVSHRFYFEDEVEKVKESESWLISIVLLGCSLGVASTSLLLQQMGPKRVLQVIGLFYILSWSLELFSQTSVQLISRFFLGFLGVGYFTAGEKLLLHTIHYDVRRYIIVFHNTMMVLGVLIGRVTSTIRTNFDPAVVCIIIPVIHYLFIQIIPEDPVHLYAKSQSKAVKSLKWYRGKGNFAMDMINIKRDWDTSRTDPEAYRYMLYSRVVYRSLLVIIGVTFFQVCSGYFIFMFYSSMVLTGEKPKFSVTVDTAIIGVCFTLTKFFWGMVHMVFSDWKVKKILVCSCLFSCIPMALFSFHLFLIELKEASIQSFDLNWTSMVFIGFFLFFYDMGLNYYPKILILHYMPVQMFKRALLIVQGIYWLLAFLNIYLFTKWFADIYSFVLLSIHVVIMFIGAWFCYFFVVEPKGKSLIQIQLAFGGNPIGRRGALFNQLKNMF